MFKKFAEVFSTLKPHSRAGREQQMRRTITRVTWNDSSTINRGGWTSLDQINPEAICTCVSIGWIIRENKKELVLAACETVDGPFGRIAAIPKSAILKRENFKHS
jgi:hypothetical protein